MGATPDSIDLIRFRVAHQIERHAVREAEGAGFRLMIESEASHLVEDQGFMSGDPIGVDDDVHVLRQCWNRLTGAVQSGGACENEMFPQGAVAKPA